MTLSSRSKSVKRTPRVRSVKSRRIRFQATSVATMSKPSLLSRVWNTQRPKILAVILILAFAGALFTFFNMDWFYVFKFDIAGTQFLTDAEIEKASEVMGYNIFFIEPRAVERSLQKLPEVKSAHVTTRMPNQMVVEIEERQSQIIWQRGNETFWVDGEGVFVRARANLGQIPIVRDWDTGAIRPGERAQPAAVAAFRAFHEVMPSPKNLEWSTARGLMFTDEHGWKIYLGNADEMAGKVAKLRALSSQLVAQKAKIQFIDLGKGDPYYQ